MSFKEFNRLTHNCLAVTIFSSSPVILYEIRPILLLLYITMMTIALHIKR